MIAIACSLLFLLTIIVRRVYYCIPAKEIKRLARAHDSMGEALYRAVAFDDSLAALLWLLIGIFAALAFTFFVLALPAALAVVAIAVLVWLGFAGLAIAFPRSFMIRFAAALAPACAWLLSHLHPVLQLVARFVRQHHRVLEHTGLYERQDVIDLLVRQQSQPDSRVPTEDVELLQRVLALGDKTAQTILWPRAEVRLVRQNETIGPKLMDELHRAGQAVFLVADENGEHVTGQVRLEDLLKARHGGTIKDVASESVQYVRDDFTLVQVLQAFRKTNQQLLVVINNCEEFLGVVTLESLLTEIMGEQSGEAITYTDRAAIANYQLSLTIPEPESIESDPLPEETPPTTPESPDDRPQQSAPESE